MLRLVCEVPLLEDTLVRLAVMGLHKDLPLTPTEAIDITEQLIRRAAHSYVEGLTVLRCEKTDIFDLLFSLCIYHYPDNIVLPKG